MVWDPWRFMLLVACLRLPESEVATRAGLSRQMGWKLKANTKKMPEGRTLKKLAEYWHVSRDWLEDGTGPSGLPLPPGLRAIIEAGPEAGRRGAILYVIKAGDGELLTRGASWTRKEWDEQIDRVNIVGESVKRRKSATN